jgi:hypothetical protein
MRDTVVDASLQGQLSKKGEVLMEIQNFDLETLRSIACSKVVFAGNF